MARTTNIETMHELPTGQLIVDPRPISVKFTEWLSFFPNFAILSIPFIIVTVLAPLAGLLTLPFLLFCVIAHLSYKSILPVRYPMGYKDEKGKKGNGIMYVGQVDSTSEYNNFKEIWLSDDDLRKHVLILGSTGSGKSEALKAIFYNALTWSSGFFIADGKADNKLPTDVYTMVRSNGRDQDLLILNFLLAGKTPEQVRRSRRRRTNKLNPFPSADADTIIQMGANLLPRVEGDAKNWQEKALNLWRSVVQSLAYKRDTTGFDLSVSTFIDYMSLNRVEDLYMEGYIESLSRGGEWSYGYAGVKNYLESGCPAYQVTKLLKKNGYGVDDSPEQGGRGGAFGGGKRGGGKEFDQDTMAYEQHSYRTNQLMPVLNLLDKTYGFIFRDKYPEIDMTDVTLRNRILVMLIPSLEKSAAEAENLGKLAIACLRVMMSKNLGAEVEGDHADLLDSKATKSPYPYIVALDELAYYFSDGIAVMFAQARSLGVCMIAAAQDLEKLTEGSKAAEAGAMFANQTTKFFMRINDSGKTAKLVQDVVGKARVAIRRTFKFNSYGYSRKSDVEVTEVDRVSTERLQEFSPGEGVINASGKTHYMKWFYMDDDLKKHRVKSYHINRFLQVAPPSREDIIANSIAIDEFTDPYKKGNRLLGIMKQESDLVMNSGFNSVLSYVGDFAKGLNVHMPAEERGILLYMAARKAILMGEVSTTTSGASSGSKGGAQSHKPSPMLKGHDGFEGQIDESVVSNAEEEDEEDMDSDPLAFLKKTPFNRKSAESVLGNVDEVYEAAALASFSKEAAKEDVVVGLISRGRTLSLSSDEFVLKGKALALLIGAPDVTDPDTGLEVIAKDDWIGGALKEASNMVSMPRSSDNTVVGFNDETMTKVEIVETLMNSPSPDLAARSFERVVAARVTPQTTPEDASIDDSSSEEIAAFFGNLLTSKSSK